jgi:hypothetical protein
MAGTFDETNVRLFDSEKALAAGEPTWSGTLWEFWKENQDGFSFGEMEDICEALKLHGQYRGGGGAAAEFLLVRVQPITWGLAPHEEAELHERAAAADPVRRELLALLKAAQPWLDHYRAGQDDPENLAEIDALNTAIGMAIAKAEGGA